jgi:curved DNA-binding protein
MDYKDYYSILGIPRDADEQTIRSAFRQKARVYHPDVNANKTEATEKFKEINEAYTVLSDPDKRTRYDLFNGRYEQYQRTSTGTRTSYRAGYGSASSSPGNDAAGSTGRASSGPSQQRQGPGRGQSQRRTYTVDEEDFERIFRGFAWAYNQTAGRRSRSGSAGNDFSDFFEALFGNLWGSAGQPSTSEPSEVRPGRDIEVTAEISLEEAFRGATRTLTYSDGRKVEVTIPPGIDTGAKLRIRGHGERVFGRPRGDLYMTIVVQPHPHLTRSGSDLRVQVTVDYELAMRSGEVSVPTMDGSVKLKIPAGTRSGQSFRLRGLGMPTVLDSTTRGDLIATVLVKAPASAPRSSAQAGARPAKSTRAAGGRKSFWVWLLQGLGAALLAMGFVALAAQTALVGGTGWELLAALAVLLLLHGLTGGSRWALAGSALAATGSIWLLSQLELVTATSLLEQAWPVLLLALGIGLFRLPGKRHR